MSNQNISSDDASFFDQDIDENVTGDDSTKNHKRSHNQPPNLTKSNLVMASNSSGFRPSSMLMASGLNANPQVNNTTTPHNPFTSTVPLNQQTSRSPTQQFWNIKETSTNAEDLQRSQKGEKIQNEQVQTLNLGSAGRVTGQVPDSSNSKFFRPNEIGQLTASSNILVRTSDPKLKTPGLSLKNQLYTQKPIYSRTNAREAIAQSQKNAISPHDLRGILYSKRKSLGSQERSPQYNGKVEVPQIMQPMTQQDVMQRFSKEILKSSRQPVPNQLSSQSQAPPPINTEELQEVAVTSALQPSLDDEYGLSSPGLTSNRDFQGQKVSHKTNTAIQQQHNSSTTEQNSIHQRLYQEKDKYFEKKKFVNTLREEEELKECTFQPNALSPRTSHNVSNAKQSAGEKLSGSKATLSQQFSPRTFNDFLHDQTAYLQRKREFETKNLLDQERQYQTMFKPTILPSKASSKRDTNNTSVTNQQQPEQSEDPQQGVTERLYQEGVERVKRAREMTSEEILMMEKHYDENLTFQPVINKERKQDQMSRNEEDKKVRSSQNGLRLFKSQGRLTEQSLDRSVISSVKSEGGFVVLKSTKTLKASEKLLGERLEKEILQTIKECLSVEQISDDLKLSEIEVFKVLDTLGYLNTQLSSDLLKSKLLIQTIMLCVNTPDSLTYHDLKLLIFTAYNLWQPTWMLNSQPAVISSQEQATENKSVVGTYQYSSREDFDKMHQRVMALVANRSQNEHVKRQKDLVQRAVKFDYDFRKAYSPSREISSAQLETSVLQQANQSHLKVAQDNISTTDPYQMFKPKINKKSEKLDKKVMKKYLSQAKSTSILPIQERPELILIKGQEYKSRMEKRQQEKKESELQGCTFVPQILTKTRPKESTKKQNQSFDHEKVESGKKIEDAKIIFEQLYSKAKQHNKNHNKTERSTNDIEFEKQKDQCTFKPKPIATQNLRSIYKTASSQISPRYNEMWKKAHNLSAQQASMDSGSANRRMFDAKQTIPEVSKSVQNPKFKNEPSQQLEVIESDKTPILFLEVNLGKQAQEKLFIYEGDIPEVAVQNFSQLHSLNDEKQSKLLSVVKEQLTLILPKILEEHS